MKKYIIPETKIINSNLLVFVCASPLRKGTWGNNDPQNEYSNKSWYDEGYDTEGELIEDDWGEIDAQ